jgi:hypothetical protein
VSGHPAKISLSPPGTRLYEHLSFPMSATAPDFVVSPRVVEVSQPFQLKFRRPGPPGTLASKGWIGLFRPGQKESQLEGRRFYYDEEGLTKSLSDPQFGSGSKDLLWSAGYAPSEPGDYELRYYRSGKLLGCSVLRAVTSEEAPHRFTERYCRSSYAVTEDSAQPQSPFWPEYLPIDPSRFLIIERSKNASLIVYHGIGSLRSAAATLPSPTDLGPVTATRWLSWGWTPEPETNLTNAFQRKMAYGIKVEADEDGRSFALQMVAMPSLVGRLEIAPGGDGPRAVFPVGPEGDEVIVQKLYVATEERLLNPIPKVLYVDMYGFDRKALDENGRKKTVRVRYDPKKMGIEQ